MSTDRADRRPPGGPAWGRWWKLVAPACVVVLLALRWAAAEHHLPAWIASALRVLAVALLLAALGVGVVRLRMQAQRAARARRRRAPPADGAETDEPPEASASGD